MNPLLNYILQVIIVSGLLYSYYHVVLRNKKFHHYNRYYLLGAAVLSISIPLLNIPVYFTEEETSSSIVYNTLTVLSRNSQAETGSVYMSNSTDTSWFTPGHLLLLLYCGIAAIVFLRIVFSLLNIRRIIRRYTAEKMGRISFLNTAEPGTPFSFFNWMFWNRDIELKSEKGEQIFRHEFFHIEQKHSLDILFLELLTVAGWFNPFFHLIKRESRAIHEFLADQFALNTSNRYAYAELLLMQVLNTRLQLVQPFFHNQIKRRIAMIISPQKTSHQYLRKLMVLPVTALLVILFAFSYKNSVSDNLSLNSKTASAANNSFFQQSVYTDTGIKPDYPVKKTVTKLASGIVISSDSIIYKPSREKALSQETSSILIVNGKRVFESALKNKYILADSVIWYAPGDKEAIRQYGNSAAAGAMIFFNATIDDLQAKGENTEDNKIFEKVEIEAAFPGGSSAWRNYLERNLNGMVPRLNNAPAGSYTVIIQFIVNLDGSISDLKALTNHGYGMEEEAIRAIKRGPKWLPAIQNGRQVKAYRSQPITYIVDNGSKKEGTVAAGRRKVLDEAVVVTYSEPTNPSFPGGDSAWKRYLAVNGNASIPTDNGAPVGKYKVNVRFIVHPDGFVSDITPLTSFGYGMEEEAVRLIKKGPRWVPATVEGTKISSYVIQPITFELTDEPDKPNYPPFIQDKQKSHILTTDEVKSIDVFSLLQLPKGTEIISYMFSIDGVRDVIEIPNTGSEINQKTREQLNTATSGKIITVDLIRIRAWDQQKKEFYVKKMPSAVWYIKD